ncbi:hypothetical protein ACFL2J_01625 [Candidatus Omnitrophota bacterium]
MDLGIFLSTKKKLVAWIIGPVLFLSILYLPIFIYFKSANNDLSEKKFMLESMPTIIEKITMAQVMLKSYQSNASKGEIIEWLNFQLNQIAGSCDFTIDSLVVRKDKSPSSSGEMIIYNISVQGKGELLGVISFFENSQAVMPLLTLDDVKLQTIGHASEHIYDAKVTFSYNNLS